MTRIINTAEVEAKKAATSQPHGFAYADKVLSTKSDGYNLQVTFGWETPQGTLSPVVTMAMPIPFVEELADVLADAARDAAARRKKS